MGELKIVLMSANAKKDAGNQCKPENNESSEVVDILLPVTLILTLRPGLKMSKTSDDSLFAASHAGLLVVHYLIYRA